MHRSSSPAARCRPLLAPSGSLPGRTRETAYALAVSAVADPDAEAPAPVTDPAGSPRPPACVPWHAPLDDVAFTSALRGLRLGAAHDVTVLKR